MASAHNGMELKGPRGSRGGTRSSRAPGLTVRSGCAVVHGCTLEQARAFAWPQGVVQHASHYIQAAQSTKQLADEAQLLLGRGSVRDGIFFGREWLKEYGALYAWLNRLNDADSWLRHYDQAKVDDKLSQLKYALAHGHSSGGGHSEQRQQQDSKLMQDSDCWDASPCTGSEISESVEDAQDAAVGTDSFMEAGQATALVDVPVMLAKETFYYGDTFVDTGVQTCGFPKPVTAEAAVQTLVLPQPRKCRLNGRACQTLTPNIETMETKGDGVETESTQPMVKERPKTEVLLARAGGAHDVHDVHGRNSMTTAMKQPKRTLKKNDSDSTAASSGDLRQRWHEVTEQEHRHAVPDAVDVGNEATAGEEVEAEVEAELTSSSAGRRPKDDPKTHANADDGESAQESSSEGNSNMASSSSGNSSNSAVRDAALTKMAYGGWKQQRDLSRQQKKMLHMQQVKADFGIT